ncbi:hypothetical protein P4C99_09695 [Pontiellaceae bacterium B1224]|nr:hypothetical protein [Pontiellaceae bacterium B1224]
MTFLMNLDQFRDWMIPIFRIGIDVTAIAFTLLLCGSIFWRKLRLYAVTLFKASLFTSGFFFLAGFLLSSYLKFKYFKLIVWDESSQAAHVLYYQYSLNSEMHLYAGCFLALYLLILAVAFRCLGLCRLKKESNQLEPHITKPGEQKTDTTQP